MGEYWVSNKRYFCRYCRIYIQDNNASRKHHEAGNHHKNAVEAELRSLYRKKDENRIEAQRTEDLLRRINSAAYKQYEKDLIQGAGGSVAVESREVKFAPYWEDQKEFSRPDPDDEDGETSHVEHDGDERPEDKMGVIGEWVRVEHQGERPFSGAALNTGGSKLFKKVRGTRRAREDTEVLEFKPEQKIAFTYSDLDSKNLEDFIDEGLGRNDPDCCDPDTAEALPLFKKRNRKSPKNLRTR